MVTFYEEYLDVKVGYMCYEIRHISILKTAQYEDEGSEGSFRI